MPTSFCLHIISAEHCSPQGCQISAAAQENRVKFDPSNLPCSDMNLSLDNPGMTQQWQAWPSNGGTTQAVPSNGGTMEVPSNGGMTQAVSSNGGMTRQCPAMEG